MPYWIVYIALFGVFFTVEVYSLIRLRQVYAQRKVNLDNRLLRAKEEEKFLQAKIDEIEHSMAQHFLFYELTRKIASCVTKSELFKVFVEEIKYLGGIEEVCWSKVPKDKGYLVFPLSAASGDELCIKTSSEHLGEYLPNFIKLLDLCIERIELYGKLQELSIYDSLTTVFSRRYFMGRYSEEFERAERLKLNLSFLMIDIDDFKKINDTYGHLVGDVVLREVARIIRDNIRDIDFVARYGGEEFSIILTETDKAGAIMVGERICSTVSQQKLRAFDELLTTTVSVGIASYPQSTRYADVLIEIADKALYKAKISGKNRMGWF